MAQQPRPDDLAQLRAELAAQRAELAAQRAVTEALRASLKHPRRRLPRRILPLAIVALLVALLPLSLLAAGPTFTDLNPNSVHNPNIQAIADAGITKGCDPGVAYCPNGLVTREEMASFLARTAGLGGNPAVANARTAQTAGSADTAITAINATNAAQLNSQPSSFYQPAGQPIANATTAQMLQGYAPNGLVRVARGSGSTSSSLALTTSYQTLAAVALTAPGPGLVLVQGNTTIFSEPTCFAGTRLRDTAAAPGTASPEMNTYTGLTAGTAYFMPVSLTWVFPVTTGGRTFVLEAYIGGGSGCYAFNGTLTALFVPFAQDGGPTLAP